MTNKTYKNKFVAIVLGLAMCLALMLGVIFASGANVAYAEGEGVAPTIVKTGGLDVDRDNSMANLPIGTVGVEYKNSDGTNYKVEATGTAPFTYTAYEWGSGNYSPLPEGLKLDSETGEISGTPVTAGTYGVRITVTNTYGEDTILAWIRILDETSKPTITLETIPNSTMYVNSYYSENITFNGFYEAFTCSVVSGTLPNGLEFVKVGVSAMLQGTPTQAGNFTFKLKIENPAGSDEKEYTIVVKDENVRPKIVSNSYFDNKEGIIGQEFSYQLQANGTNTTENPLIWYTYQSDGSTLAEKNTSGTYDLVDSNGKSTGLTLSETGYISGTLTGRPTGSIKIGVKNYNAKNNSYDTSENNFYLTSYYNNAIKEITLYSATTTCEKGKTLQFFATIEGTGNYSKTLSYWINGRSSTYTTIDSNGLLTVGANETATTITIIASGSPNANTGSDDVRTSYAITLTDHVHELKHIERVEKTCQTDGNVEHYACSTIGCGKYFENSAGTTEITNVVIPASHEYGDLIDYKAPTCNAKGMQSHYECSVCHQLASEIKTEKTQEELEIATDEYGHSVDTTENYVPEVPATCISDGHKEYYVCSLCGQKVLKDYAKWTVYTDEQLKIEKSSTAHKYGTWQAQIEPTCTKTGVYAHQDCEYCKKHFNSAGGELSDDKLIIAVDDSKHTYGSFVDKVEATCIAVGRKEHCQCTECKSYFIYDYTYYAYVKTTWEALEIPVDATAHSYTSHDRVEAKCNSTGNIGYYDCSLCHKYFKSFGGVEVTWESIVIAKDSSNHVGYDTTWTKDETHHWHKCTGCDTGISSKATHTPDRAEATETEAVKCSVCDYVITPAISHTHDLTFVAETPATCSNTGTKAHYTCSGCSKVFADADGNTELPSLTIDIDANNHTYGALVAKLEPTCSSEGRSAYYHCSCGKYFTENKTETTYASLTLDKVENAHDYDAWHDEVSATCSATGTKGYKDCKICRKHFDNDGVQITDLTLAISPNAHDYDAWHDEVPATCSTTGTKGYKDCKTCHNHYASDGITKIDNLVFAVNPDNHTYTVWIAEIPATETEQGTKGHYDCSGCSKHFDSEHAELTDLVIPKLRRVEITVVGGTGAGTYLQGEEVTVKANDAPEGKVFKGWQDASGTIVSTEVEYKFTVSDEVNLTAVYADKTVEPVDPTDPTEPTIDKEEPKGLSGGAIAGIVVGSVAVAGLGGFAIFWFAIKKKSFADLIAAIKGIFKKK